MTGAPEAWLLADGERLHLHHGPIDLIVGAKGPPAAIARAYGRAQARFADLLAVLVEELAMLRKPVAPPRWRPRGPVAGRMMDAVWPHRRAYVTPMAAVAGAVADEMLQALASGHDLEHVWVNNGGDVAFDLAPGASLTLGMVGDLRRPAIDGIARLAHDLPARGVATSGWTGRSLSRGIADAVTVLARNAAAADAAATLIANAVDVDHPAVERRPARELDDDTDLGDLPVTVAVGELDDGALAAALDAGEEAAGAMRRAGLILAAAMTLKGRRRIVGDGPAALAA